MNVEMDMKKQNEGNRTVLREVQLSFVVRPDWTDLDPDWTDSESTALVSSFRRRHYTEMIDQIYLEERRKLNYANRERDHPFLYGCQRRAVFGSSGPDAGLVGFSLSARNAVDEDFAERIICDSIWVAGRIVSRTRSELPQVGLTVTARLIVSKGVRTDHLPGIVVHDFRGLDYAESFSKSQKGK